MRVYRLNEWVQFIIHFKNSNKRVNGRKYYGFTQIFVIAILEILSITQLSIYFAGYTEICVRILHVRYIRIEHHSEICEKILHINMCKNRM